MDNLHWPGQAFTDNLTDVGNTQGFPEFWDRSSHISSTFKANLSPADSTWPSLPAKSQIRRPRHRKGTTSLADTINKLSQVSTLVNVSLCLVIKNKFYQFLR